MSSNPRSTVIIPAGSVRLEGEWTAPDVRHGAVIFAHGSGSSRHSPRNRQVAAGLQSAGFGTLLFDLLTAHEDSDRAARFDIGRLTERLIAATRWLDGRPEMVNLPLGYFGASTGAAAALSAAAALAPRIAAVVSRGGRPDLAANALHRVQSPTLLIVGGMDPEVLRLNRGAARMLAGPGEVAVVPGATHLFEEPGALDDVMRLAMAWFERYLRPTGERGSARPPEAASGSGPRGGRR